MNRPAYNFGDWVRSNYEIEYDESEDYLKYLSLVDITTPAGSLFCAVFKTFWDNNGDSDVELLEKVLERMIRDYFGTLGGVCTTDCGFDVRMTIILEGISREESKEHNVTSLSRGYYVRYWANGEPHRDVHDYDTATNANARVDELIAAGFRAVVVEI